MREIKFRAWNTSAAEGEITVEMVVDTDAGRVTDARY